MLLRPSHLAVRVKGNCGSIGCSLVAEGVVFTELLPTKFNAHFEVTVRLIPMLIFGLWYDYLIKLLQELDCGR